MSKDVYTVPIAAGSTITKPTMSLRFVAPNQLLVPRLQQLWIVEEVGGPCWQEWRDVPIEIVKE